MVKAFGLNALEKKAIQGNGYFNIITQNLDQPQNYMGKEEIKWKLFGHRINFSNSTETENYIPQRTGTKKSILNLGKVNLQTKHETYFKKLLILCQRLLQSSRLKKKFPYKIELNINLENLMKTSIVAANEYHNQL